MNSDYLALPFPEYKKATIPHRKEPHATVIIRGCWFVPAATPRHDPFWVMGSNHHKKQ
jgi:hypothetical protein